MFLVTVYACIPGKYTARHVADIDLRDFENIEIAEVEIGMVTDELLPEIPTELRTTIIQEIRKKAAYKYVGSSASAVNSVLEIRTVITGYDPGSYFENHTFIGIGPGKARLLVKGEFFNKESGELVAEGIFIGYHNGRIWGGYIDQLKMSKKVARLMANFLVYGAE